jgi:hypothetical protein
MTNPWDIPPFPEQWDKAPGYTYKMVGKSLSEWEYLEYVLSDLYSQLIGQHAKIAALRKYGEPRIFAERAVALKKAAEVFFIKHPNQETEATLDNLLLRTQGFSDRRNEIAHGIVSPAEWNLSASPSLKEIAGYALIPPLYTHRKLDDKNLPKYIYTAAELERFASAFLGLGLEAVSLRLRIVRMLQP